MTHLHKQRAAALIIAAILALVFTGCPNNAGGSGGGTTPPAPSADKTYTVGGVNFTMKDIAAVTNGSVGHTDYHGYNDPHTVSLSAYRIGETEVTQELWEKVMGTNPSSFRGSPEGGEVQEKRPVEYVNWFECIAFCNELTKKVPELGESQCVYTYNGNTYTITDAAAKKVPVMDMSKNGFRLPTEAEWEWAAKGGKDYKWAGTNKKAQLVNYAWYKNDDGGDANGKTHQVKMKQPNAYGLYDMSGNVWEWCWDWYDDFSGTLPPDYAGATSGDARVLRGGSWFNDADDASRACRSCNVPHNRFHYVLGCANVGLRVVCRP